LSRKQTNSLAFKKIKQTPKIEREDIDLEKLEVKMSFKVMTREERIQEANKPLYLKRYE